MRLVPARPDHVRPKLKAFLSKQSGQRPEQASLLAEKGRENGMRENVEGAD